MGPRYVSLAAFAWLLIPDFCVAKFEVVGHKYADLSEFGYGVALLNDCKCELRGGLEVSAADLPFARRRLRLRRQRPAPLSPPSIDGPRRRPGPRRAYLLLRRCAFLAALLGSSPNPPSQSSPIAAPSLRATSPSPAGSSTPLSTSAASLELSPLPLSLLATRSSSKEVATSSSTRSSAVRMTTLRPRASRARRSSCVCTRRSADTESSTSSRLSRSSRRRSAT